jgi:hypothetical protein
MEADMAEKTWEQRTDATLDRIETQIDDGDKQTGFALDFRERVVTSLTKIEGALEQNGKDHVEMKTILSKIPTIESALALNEKDHAEIKSDLKELKIVSDKIPKMEIGLNNHLHSHDLIKKSVYYPVLVVVILTFLGLFCKLVLKVF